MGSALVAGVIRANLTDPKSLLIIDPDQLARERAASLGCAVTHDPAAAHDCETILLAVKPQSFPELATTVGSLQSSTLVISVMAGVSFARLRDALGDHARCVRCMPNVAAQIGMAVTTYAFDSECTPRDRDLALRILGSMGSTVEVAESMFDAATATGGTGPAYLFLLAEAMIDSATRLGFDRLTADRLVRQSLLGAATLLARSDRSPADLRGIVTSQGGTTSAAMAVLEAHGFRAMMHDALRAARDRGRDLAAAAARHVEQSSGSEQSR